MSVRKDHRNKAITLTIDGKECTGVYGETILEIARRNDIYVPTMCNLPKVSPIASCRMCVVNVQGVDGDILSCQEKAVNASIITTNNEHLERERTNIMKLYDVNHPLQCGVCDKSGECDLQNKTLEFNVESQPFAVKDQPRKQKSWGVLGYDPHLCIMCEKCVHTCNEVIGATALYIKPGGYKSTIDIKMSRCEQCGDCISVCPVGALVSNPYKYTSNAWESDKVPATCAHCSTGCALIYDTKHAGVDAFQDKRITRVTNDFEFSSLCGAGRFSYEFENKEVSALEEFDVALEAFKNAGTIKFNSYITNEEAFILQKLKEKLGINLVNNDAKNYQNFLNTYNSVTGKTLYSATNDTIEQSDGIILIGSHINRDNPGVKYSINIARMKQRAQFIYMHTLDDKSLSNKYTKFVKYEVGAEEAILAMLSLTLIPDIPSEYQKYFDDLDIGNLSGESSVGEEEIDDIKAKFIRTKNKTIIIGTDVFGHENATNIAVLVGLIDKYSDFNIVLVPSQTNTLGVSLLCDLDEDIKGKVVGYNEGGDYTFGSVKGSNLYTPSLNQQEGTFVNINHKVVNTNVALSFNGPCLNDLANKILDNKVQYTVDYTKFLPKNVGFNGMKFDELKNYYDKYGKDLRGYYLERLELENCDFTLNDVADLKSYNGSVIYRCEPMFQFNDATSKTSIMKKDSHLRGSASFAKAANIKSGDLVEIIYMDQVVQKVFKTDTSVQGTIALYPTHANELSIDLISSNYRYKQVKIQKVES